MEEFPPKFLSISSSENRDSIGSLNDGEDEEFYEKMEAPKFVDFSVPDHYIPDDHYWFCLRVGCDRKHEEEMDSEAIYNNFVLRVMAARSPNVRLRKALDKKASRTPIKCPLSAPPKSSKPRLSRMAVISSFSKKIADEKKVVRPILKPGSTPVTKTKPVAAKYLTTPRNKKGTSDRSSFRSVQYPKPVNVEVPTSRIVAKALVFGSPKKAIKLKTSVELRTPISELCQGLNKLEISNQRKRVLGYSSKSSKNLGNSSSRRQLNSQKVVRAKPEKPLQTGESQEAKSGRSIKTKIRGQLSQQQDSKKLLASDETHSLKNKESCDNGESGIQESFNEALTHPTVPPATLASSCEATKAEEINFRLEHTDRQEHESITAESCAPSVDQSNTNNSSVEEQSGNDLEDGDDKENAAASDENRIPNNNLKQNGRKVFGMHDESDKVRKKVTQAQVNLKETKVKKPKATNPKPFRLRTDERGVLKESTLDRRLDPLVRQSENTNVSTPVGKLKLPQKHVNYIQKGSTLVVLKTPKGQDISKSAASPALESKRHERKLKSNAIQRLERFRKLTSLPERSVRPQGLVSTKQEMVSYLIPGQKLDVIHEASSPEVSEPRTIRKPAGDAPSTDDAASRSSSHGRRHITVAVEPKFHSTRVPRNCTKKLK